MKVAAFPKDETSRLEAVLDYNILDTMPERDFDDITGIASEICQTPIALITLVDADRQWFKSKIGIDVPQLPREFSVCSHAILQPGEVFVIEDASKDERFADHPMAAGPPHVAFYAGACLISPEGYPVGTLCVMDVKPRKLSESQLNMLMALANQVVGQMELRKQMRRLEQANEEAMRVNEELEKFTSIASSDMKAPLRGIMSITEWMKEEYYEKLDAQGKEYISLLHSRAHFLDHLISGMSSFSKMKGVLAMEVEEVHLNSFLDDILGMLTTSDNIRIVRMLDVSTVVTKRIALQQILQNLIINSITFCTEEIVQIIIGVSETDEAVTFSVTDNGPGIPEAYHDRIFELFQTLGMSDRFNIGAGIGLATVKKLVDGMNGTIEVNSTVGEGATFRVIIPK